MKSNNAVARMMWTVVLALVPSGIAGIIIFGLPALWVILVAVVSAVLAEAAIQLLMRNKPSILDGSAFLTGLLLAYNLPSSAPLWLAAVGSIFSIVIVKQAAGGLGKNMFNPALAGRVFLVLSWPGFMESFPRPFACDAVASATPLALIKEARPLEHISYLDFFLGKRAGCIGEVCIAALLLGAVLLLIKGYISWRIPFSYIGTCGLIAYCFGPNAWFSGDWLLHILSGGLILGAFFMATDYVTAPVTRKGQIIFGVACGLVTMAIRLRGGYPEGVCYAILIMNAFVPLINKHTAPRLGLGKAALSVQVPHSAV